jgi:hypothetical protein
MKKIGRSFNWPKSIINLNFQKMGKHSLFQGNERYRMIEKTGVFTTSGRSK